MELDYRCLRDDRRGCGANWTDGVRVGSDPGEDGKKINLKPKSKSWNFILYIQHSLIKQYRAPPLYQTLF